MNNVPRRSRVLIEPAQDVARKLKEHPGEWFLIGIGELDRSRVLAQTAYRIREGQLADFAPGKDGHFEATSTADTARADKVADVELSARWIPAGVDWVSRDPGA